MSAQETYIAGVTGFIGSAVLDRFAANEKCRVLMATHRDLELQEADAVLFLFDSNSPVHVIPAAGNVGGIPENKTYPAYSINANLASQLNVLATAHRVGVRTPTPGAVS